MSADELVDECNSLTATAAAAKSQDETISLYDGAEDHDETFEDAHEEPIDALSPIVAVEETQPEEHAAGGEDFVAANDGEPVERAMVLYQPSAPVMQEEQEQADAHDAEVEAFSGLNDPIETTENPR